MLTEIKAFARNTYGWQGAHGVAYTITAKLCSGTHREKRAVVRIRRNYGGEAGTYVVSYHPDGSLGDKENQRILTPKETTKLYDGETVI